MWFSLRSPELAEDFERLMAGDRDIVRGSLDTVSEWRLTRPLDLPGQSIEAADYVLIAEIVEIQRWQEQATELVQHLADDLGHLSRVGGCSSWSTSFDRQGLQGPLSDRSPRSSSISAGPGSRVRRVSGGQA
jgi:hypothetical protein